MVGNVIPHYGKGVEYEWRLTTNKSVTYITLIGVHSPLCVCVCVCVSQWWANDLLNTLIARQLPTNTHTHTHTENGKNSTMHNLYLEASKAQPVV